MLISILLPIFKPDATQLIEAVESIKSQSHQDFKCIFLYDSPNEKITGILDSYVASDSRFILIYCENQGLSHALNRGIEACDSEFIVRMDADDICMPNRLEIQLSYITGNNLDIVGGHYYVIDNCGKLIDARIVPTSKEEITITLAKGVPFAHSSVMFKKSFIVNKNLYYTETGVVAEDYDLWVRMHLSGAKFGNVDSWVIKFRDSDTSLNKRVLKECSKNANDISKRYINANIRNIILALSEINTHRFKYRVQESIGYVVFVLAFKKFRITELKHLKQITKRNLVNSFFAFVKANL